jgi:hypothetical protein
VGYKILNKELGDRQNAATIHTQISAPPKQGILSQHGFQSSRLTVQPKPKQKGNGPAKAKGYVGLWMCQRQ